MEEIWVEKYRPEKLSDVIGQPHIINRLESYVKLKNLPHLLFAGAAGTGKTSAAIALAHELYGDSWQNNFAELNASDERGIEVVRNKIKNFARTAPINAPFKILFLDEADSLTPDAQSALRRTMESFSMSCRFILSCNYSSKIIEPIQSRCAIYRFKPIDAAALKKRLERIATNEGVDISTEALDAITYVAGGDLRKAINTLQSAASIGASVDQKTIYQITATANPDDIQDLLHASLDGSLVQALELLDSLIKEQGLSGSDILIQVHRALLKADIPDPLKVRLIDRIGEIDFRLSEGANERIQLEALIADFMLSNQKA
ncbi:MAG: replication factor C small subunit [Euryarchaeota archaeon]|nr:replication factor C small subunit [Euryarchaeota archaeon]